MRRCRVNAFHSCSHRQYGIPIPTGEQQVRAQNLSCIFTYTVGDCVNCFGDVWFPLFCTTWSSIYALYSPSRVCQSIFATRIILHIRDVDKRRTEDAFTSTAVRSLMFADILGQIQVEIEDEPIKVVNAQDQA
jgi:hypothetical protein